MTSASVDNGSLAGGESGRAMSVDGRRESFGSKGSTMMRRASSSSNLLNDYYDHLPYRKESPQVQRERKKVVNSRRHYLEQKQQLFTTLSTDSMDHLPSPKPMTAEFQSSDPLELSTIEQENLPTQANQPPLSSSSSRGRPMSRTASPMNPPQRSNSPFSYQGSLGAGRGNPGTVRSSNASVKTINLTEAVKYDLERSKAKRKELAEKEYQEKIKKKYGRTKIDSFK